MGDTRDPEEFVDELDAAIEHVQIALNWIEDHGEIDAGDRDLLCEAELLLCLVMLNESGRADAMREGEVRTTLAAIAATLGCPVGEVAGRVEKLERGARLAYTLIERVKPHLDWGDQGSAWAAHRLVGLGLGLIQPDAPTAPHANGDEER